jgi:hypothetical protein
MSQSVSGIGPTAAARRPSAAESAVQEALETPAVTRQEALKGDRVAQRKLAREQRAKLTTDKVQEAPPAASEKKSRVNVVA